MEEQRPYDKSGCNSPVYQNDYIVNGGMDLSIIDNNGSMSIIRPLTSLQLKHIQRELQDDPTIFIGQDPKQIADYIFDFYSHSKEQEFSVNTAVEKKRFSWDSLVDGIEELIDY